MASYAEIYRRSLERPDEFWLEAAGAIDWVRRPSVAIDRSDAVAVFRRAHVVVRLPKTRSGEILRGTLRTIAEGREVRVPSTIDDPAILDEIAPLLR